jgi:long-chain acyl-CoA synthetase
MIALRALECPVDEGWQCFVAVCSANRTEWVLSDLASVLFNYVLVPMHHTLDIETMDYILNHSQTSVIVVSSEALEKVLLAAKTSTHLKLIVCMDDIDEPSELAVERMNELLV